MRTVINSSNIIHVLKQVWLEPGISRIEISKRLGLDKSTVTIAVNRLTQLSLIEETAAASPPKQGGRPPIGLKVKNTTGIILGLEIQTDHFSAVMIDLAGEQLYKTSGDLGDDKTLVENFLTIYKQMFYQAEQMKLPILAIGLGLPGTINPYKGIINQSVPLAVYEKIYFADEIRAFVPVPVFIDNDANCGCWAELSNREENSRTDFLTVLGEFRRNLSAPDSPRLLAVGMGLVINERVHFGQTFTAGEYKSPSWRPGPASIGQFSHTISQLQQLNSNQEIIDAVQNELCRDIAFAVNVLGFSRIVLSGDMVRYFDQLEPLIQEELDINKVNRRDEEITITPSTYGETAVSFGAAAMVLEHLFLTYETPSENPWNQEVGIDLMNSIHQKIDSFYSARKI